MEDNCKHEGKNCPRCNGNFECKVGDIVKCQCNGVRLPADVQDLLAQQYEDCLCRRCLLELSSKQHSFGDKFASGSH